MIVKSLSKRASLNALASIIDYGARVGVEFVINPLLVAGLGNYLYGLWRILWRLNGYMDAAGGRSAQVLKWAVAKDQTLANYDDKRSYVGGTVVVWVLFFPGLALLGGLLIWLAPKLLKVPAEFLWSVQLTMGLLLINVIILGLAEIPKAVLQGENQGYRRMGLSALMVLIGGTLTALAVHLHMGLYGVATAAILTTLLTTLVFLRVVRKHVSWFGIAWPSWEIVRWFSGVSGWFVLWKFVSQLMLAGDILILGIFDSVVKVTTYTLSKYVPETLIRLSGMVVFNISPGLGGIIGAGDLEKARRVRSEIMAFTWLLLTVAGASILLWNHLFVQLWVGGKYYAGPVSTLLIVILVAQITLIRNDANVIDLTLDVKKKVLVGVLGEGIALSLAALMVGYYKLGIIGLCAGSIAGHLVVSLSYPWFVGRFLGISYFQQIKSTLRPLLFTTLIFAFSLSIHHFEDGMLFEKFESWYELILGAIATSLCIFILAFYGGLSKYQRKGMLKRLRLIAQ